MGNRIPRKATRLDVTWLVDNNVSSRHMVAVKDDCGRWIGTDDNGKEWYVLVGHLRNADLARITVLE